MESLLSSNYNSSGKFESIVDIRIGVIYIKTSLFKAQNYLRRVRSSGIAREDYPVQETKVYQQIKNLIDTVDMLNHISSFIKRGLSHKQEVQFRHELDVHALSLEEIERRVDYKIANPSELTYYFWGLTRR